MRKLSLITGLLLFVLGFGTAQEATLVDYERMIENALEIEFRKYAIESMGLNKEEIIEFDPIFRDYMDKKNDLIERQFTCIERYQQEMAEDDRLEDELEETAEFVEDYWELKIDGAKLRNDYYDKLEDKIGPFKALEFFMIEESLENQVQQERVVEFIPVYITVDKSSMGSNSSSNKWNNRSDRAQSDKWTKKGSSNASTYSSEVAAYNKWVNNHKKGNVSLDHQYTHDGISQLTKTMVAIAKAQGLSASSYQSTKNELMKMADQLRKDPKSTEHADITRKAFESISSMLATLHTKGKNSDSLSAVERAAKKINPDELLTNQAKHIHNFFASAQTVVNEISGNMTENQSMGSYDSDDK
jgi:hypothetical protein